MFRYRKPTTQTTKAEGSSEHKGNISSIRWTHSPTCFFRNFVDFCLWILSEVPLVAKVLAIVPGHCGIQHYFCWGEVCHNHLKQPFKQLEGQYLSNFSGWFSHITRWLWWTPKIFELTYLMTCEEVDSLLGIKISPTSGMIERWFSFSQGGLC